MAARSTRRQLEVVVNADRKVFAVTAAGTGAALDATPKLLVNAGVASGTGAANNAPVISGTLANAILASGTGTANDATIVVVQPSRPSVATGTGTAYNTAMTRVPAVTVAAVTTLASVTFTVVSNASPSTILATTTIPMPSAVGIVILAATVAATASVGTPTISTTPTPATVTAVASIPTPTISTSSSSTPVPTVTVPRWTLYDPDTGQIYEFDINPSDEDYQPYGKNISYKNTLPGKSIIYEIQKDATSLTWSGTVLQQGQLATLQSWYDKRSPVQVTDDLARTFDIYITEFTPKRVRSVEFPWMHTYDMKALVQPAFSPLSISGLIAWYDASDLTTITSSLGLVSQWSDLSGNARHLVNPSTAPTTGVDTQNGLNVIKFTGSNALYATISVAATNAVTCYMVVKPFGVINNFERAMSVDTGGNDYDNTGSMSAILREVTSDIWGSYYNGAMRAKMAMSNAAHVIVTQRSGDTSKVWVDGVAGTDVTGLGTSNFGYTRLWLGGDHTGAKLNGDIGEAFVSSAADSAQTVVNASAYLKAKWATP